MESLTSECSIKRIKIDFGKESGSLPSTLPKSIVSNVSTFLGEYIIFSDILLSGTTYNNVQLKVTTE